LAQRLTGTLQDRRKIRKRTEENVSSVLFSAKSGIFRIALLAKEEFLRYI